MKSTLRSLTVLTIIFTSWVFLVSAQNTNTATQPMLAQPLGTNPATVVPSSAFDANSPVIQRMQDQLAEVRRDQLNYRIEKEILEKTYSSNIQAYSNNTQTISTIVTILFGVFAILGFFGLKDLTSLKRDFVTELERLREARKDLETASKEFAKKQETVESEYKKLYEQSQEQDKKIQVLQLREKIATIITSGNFPWALENLAVALSLDPKNPGLLWQKSRCLWRLGDLSNALLVIKEVLAIAPRDETPLTDCLELMLLQKDFDGFSNLASSNASIIKAKHGGKLTDYLHALELYQKGDHAALKEQVEKSLNSLPPQKSKMMQPWSFDELRAYLKDQPETAQKTYLLILVDVLDGAMSRNEALTKLNPR